MSSRRPSNTTARSASSIDSQRYRGIERNEPQYENLSSVTAASQCVKRKSTSIDSKVDGHPSVAVNCPHCATVFSVITDDRPMKSTPEPSAAPTYLTFNARASQPNLVGADDHRYVSLGEPSASSEGPKTQPSTYWHMDGAELDDLTSVAERGLYMGVQTTQYAADRVGTPGDFCLYHDKGERASGATAMPLTVVYRSSLSGAANLHRILVCKTTEGRTLYFIKPSSRSPVEAKCTTIGALCTFMTAYGLLHEMDVGQQTSSRRPIAVDNALDEVAASVHSVRSSRSKARRPPAQ